MCRNTKRISRAQHFDLIERCTTPFGTAPQLDDDELSWDEGNFELPALFNDDDRR